MITTVKFIRDDSKTFTLGGRYSDTASWGITKISGLTTVSNSISSETPAVGDGCDVVAERIEARNIDIQANVKNQKNNGIERSKAMSFFNSKHHFIVYVTSDNTTRWISAKIEKFDCPEQTPKKNVYMSLALKCSNPYFNSNDNYGKNIASITGMFGFPYISPAGKGFNVGVYNFAKEVEIENTGDVDTYATIIINATGEVENPKIKQNDVYIRVIDNLVSGDTIEIDLVENTITKNGMNCIGKVDRTSSFTDMVLTPGCNLISFDADNGDGNMEVVLYYNMRYLGV